jgi:hypothetical protein
LSFAAIQTGTVLVYPYLWEHEHANQATEGRKPRRVAVGVRISAKEAGGNDRVILFPITSQRPADAVLSVEIPETERRRAGLDHDKSLWIILDEYNQDIIGASFYLDPAGPVGVFGKAFFSEVLKLALTNLGSAKAVDRRA